MYCICKQEIAALVLSSHNNIREITDMGIGKLNPDASSKYAKC